MEERIKELFGFLCWWASLNKELVNLGLPELFYGDVMPLYNEGKSPRDTATILLMILRDEDDCI